MLDPGRTFRLDPETIPGSSQLICQTQSVGTMRINVHFHRNPLIMKCLIEQQGILYRYTVIFCRMPQKRRRCVRIYLIFQ